MRSSSSSSVAALLLILSIIAAVCVPSSVASPAKGKKIGSGLILGTSKGYDGYVPECKDKKAFLIFDPPVLQINDYSFDVPFSVKLASKPSGEVTVFLDGKGLSFSDNTITFDPKNWNVPQKLYLMTTPVFYKDQSSVDVEVVATVDGACESYTGCKQSYHGKRYKFEGGSCVVSGDPHFKLFNGKTVTHMGVGVYHLIDSEYLSVQSYQYPCVPVPGYPATCVGAVAVRYGDSAAIVSVAKKGDYSKVDLKNYGHPSLTRLSEDLEGIDYYPKDKAESDKWEFKLDDGSTITITVGNLNGVSWLDVNIFVQAGYYGKVGGLCNAHDEKYKETLHCSDGKSKGYKEQSDIEYWANSWKVKDDVNMFYGKYQAGWKKWSKSKPYKPKKGCQATTYKTCAPKTTQPPKTTTTKIYVTKTKTKTTTKPVEVTTSTTKATVVTSTSTTEIVYTSSSSVYTSTSTSTSVYTTTTVVPTSTVVPVTTTTTTTEIVETYTSEVVYTETESSTAPITTTAAVTTTSTKTSCTVPPYKPTEYTYQTETPKTTIVPGTTVAPVVTVTTTTTKSQGTVYTTTTTVSVPAGTVPAVIYTPTYTTIPKPPVQPNDPYYGGDDDDDDDEDDYHVPCPYDYRPPSVEEVMKIEATCKSILTIKGCPAICPIEHRNVLRACVIDMLTTGSYAFAESTRRTLASTCEIMSSYLVEDDNDAKVTAATTVRASAGFGDEVACKNDCSGKGICSNIGCQCVSPWTGDDCSINKNTLPAVMPISKSKVVEAPKDGSTPQTYSNLTLISNDGGVQIEAVSYPEDPLPPVEDTKPKAATSPASGSTPATTSAGNYVQNGAVRTGSVVYALGVVAAIALMA
ncbi:hypothetical protein HDU97_007377 [Phlyctochytrium planicorne]|nr:hypothetical protein HDU97_007377 [Phlyctochytrium planicorne]